MTHWQQQGGDLNLLDAGRKRDQLAAVFESVFGETAAQPEHTLLSRHFKQAWLLVRCEWSAHHGFGRSKNIASTLCGRLEKQLA